MAIAEKQAAKPDMSYGLVGELQLSQSGWLLLQVPNAIARGAFMALNEPGAEMPRDSNGRFNAHVSVMRPEEIEEIGGSDKIVERGRDFHFTLGPVRSTVPGGWPEMSKVWFIEVRSPELKKLRKSYGLTPLPHNNEYQFHITVAVRKKNVLGDNAVAKAASKGAADCNRQGTGIAASPRRKCPSCGKPFPPGEPYPDVQNCEACERYGPPKKEAEDCNDIEKAAISTKQMIVAERRKVEQPTEDQAEAGNYRMGHIKLHGLDISIENGKGSTRSGTSPDGKKWSVKMQNDYGYIRSSEGPDGDSVDVFVCGSPDTELVFVVHQQDPKTGKFDEHKCMLGCNTQEEAEEAYLANYEKGWKGMGEVVVLTIPQFKSWLKGDTKKPIKKTLAEKLGAADCNGGWRRVVATTAGAVDCNTGTPKFVDKHVDCNYDEAGSGTKLKGAADCNHSGDVDCDGRQLVATALGAVDCNHHMPASKNAGAVDCNGQEDFLSKTAVLGIPDRSDPGDLSQLSPGLIDFVIQHHLAQRAGPHYDVRFGTPETGLYSWATRHELPEPGSRRALFRQPLHSHDYGSYEGNLPRGGYGAGQVKIRRKGQILVTKVKPGLIEFTTADQRYPERFKLLRPAGWKDDDWLLINTTPRESLPYAKVHYKKIDGTQVESALDKMQEGDSIEAKIDGASSLVKLLEKGVEITSYRTSKETGRPIVHTERVLHGRPEMQIPKELVGTVLKGELYGTRARTQGDGERGRSGGGLQQLREGVTGGVGAPAGDAGEAGRPDREVIPAQELGGILNASLANALRRQLERDIRLKLMIYDIQRLGDQPIDPHQVTRPERRRMMEQVIQHLPDKVFSLSLAASSPEEARRLWAQIQAGEHPLTHEGIVGHPATGRPWKSKLLDESDVHVTGVFPGEGRLAGTGAGGFEYSLEPGGQTVGRVGTGLSDETRREMWADPEAFIGRVAKIRAQGQFPDSGAYRAPALLSFHEDYPLLTKEGEIVSGPYATVAAIHRCFPQANIPLDRGFEKHADEEKRPPIIAVDLDGTVIEYDGWVGEENFGDPRPGARKALKELQRRGFLIVINTCRGNVQAVKDHLHENDLPYDYVNESPHQPPGTSDKIQADVYIDDKAISARQPWSKITKETIRRVKAANQGSFYLAAIPGTPVSYDPAVSPVQNVIRQLERVRRRGDQAIQEAYTQDSLANAQDPSRSMRQLSLYLAGKRGPIVSHPLDRLLQGDLVR